MLILLKVILFSLTFLRSFEVILTFTNLKYDNLLPSERTANVLKLFCIWKGLDNYPGGNLMGKIPSASNRDNVAPLFALTNASIF